MGFLQNLKSAIQNPDLSKLSPQQRADAERKIAEASERKAAGAAQRAREQAAFDAATADDEVLFGPARNRPSVLGAVAADFDRGEPDPARSAAIAAAERAARDAARRPYTAPDFAAAGGVHFTRVVTTGRSQLAEIGHLLSTTGLAARPDLLWGITRVPDRLEPRTHPESEADRPVEWELVHAPIPPGLPRVPVQAVWLGVDQPWARRRVGDRSVVDEELAVDVCARLGIEPTALVGVARVLEATAPFVDSPLSDKKDHETMQLRQLGVAAFHTYPGAEAAFSRLTAALPLDHQPPPGLHTEALNWGAIAAVVHPRVQLPPQMPSPAPHLPATPQELITMYLEVVGVRPEHAVATGATVYSTSELVPYGNAITEAWAGSPALPCADGVARPRWHGATRVVVSYHDQPDYAAGRDRWRAYCNEVLQARLHLRVGLGDPVQNTAGATVAASLPSGLRGLGSLLDRVTGETKGTDDMSRSNRLPTWQYTLVERN